jgi:hypothetical protein
VANGYVADIINLARDWIDEPLNTGRFSDAFMVRQVNNASKYLNRDILFPLARYVISTVANQQQYVVDPAFLDVQAAYLNGQLLVPSDTATAYGTLEGHQIGLYDQSGTAAPVEPGSAAPSGVVGTYTPQWISTYPATYPVANYQSGVGLTDAVSFPGQRPTYTWEGGSFTVIPAPAATGTNNLVIRGVIIVPAITATTQYTLYTDSMNMALAWKVVEYCKMSDDSDRAAEGRNYAASQYDKEMRQWRTWNRRRTGDQPHTLFVRTNRSAYIRGDSRFLRGNSGGGYP